MNFLEAIPHVAHGFHTRLGGAPEGTLLARQVHGTRTVIARAPWNDAARPEADALVTDVPHLPIGVVTADCVPVLFASLDGRVVGAAHAGWRGALGGVLESTIDAMRGLGACPENIASAIGPCIRQPSYEVGAEFRETFLAADSSSRLFFQNAERSGHFLFDLAGYVALRLKKAGITRLYDTRQDTLTNEAAYCSYRRACQRGENAAGRQVSSIFIRPA